MRKNSLRSRFLPFAMGLVASGLPTSAILAQTPTPAQMQVFQSLPADQQQAILQQVGGGAGQGGGSQSANQQAATKRIDETAQRVRAERPDESPGVLKPDDTVIVQITGGGAATAGSSASVVELVRSRNPYRLDQLGQLNLPGFPPISLGGLSDEQANQRLAVEPTLNGFSVRLTRLALAKVGLSGLKRFGYDLFDDAPSTFSPVTDVPVPADYVVGAGDELGVQLFGSQNRTLRLVVGRDGSVSFPELGPIRLGGMTFNAAKSAIESRVAQQMIGVQANVTMGDTRSIRVFVLGEARRPGSYTISGLGTMTSALFASGGVKSIGSLRDIQLKRQGSVVRHLDLYDLLIHGNTADDAKLLPGDVIFIPPVGPTVSVDGEVKRPAIYEVRGENGMADLVTLAGGLTPEADATRASLTRIDEDRRRVVLDVDLARAKGRTQKVRNGDILRVERLRPQIDSGVLLAGAVHRPGAVPWHEGLKLTDVIGSIDELKPDADSHYVLVRRETGPERKVEVLSGDLAAALQAPTSSANLKLMPRDRVTVFELAPGRDRIIKPLLEELRLQSGVSRPTEIVRVGGRVKVPGDYPLEAGMRIGDLLRAGGNLDAAAYSGKAELARYEVTDAGARQTQVIEVDLMAIQRGERSANLALQPFDYLLIKEATDWSEQRSVTLQGEVRFPGTYPIRRDETLHEVINRAGGLTPQAFAKGSVFMRTELREREQKQLDLLSERMQSDLATMALQATAASQATGAQSMQAGQALLSQLKQVKAVGRLVIDLPKVVASEVGSAQDVLLRDGDTLVVPKPRQEVTILGEVQSPTSHLYAKNLSMEEYIQKSGGFTRKADKSKAYVVRADGNVVADNGSWFSRSSGMAIQPGDTIVVPLDIERMPKLPLWQAVTQIFYNLTVALAAVKTF